MKNLKVLIVVLITISNFLHVFSQTTLKFEALKVDISSSANIELKAYDSLYPSGSPNSEQPYFIVDWDDNSVDTIYCSMNTNILMWNVLAGHIDTMVTHNYTIPGFYDAKVRCFYGTSGPINTAFTPNGELIKHIYFNKQAQVDEGFLGIYTKLLKPNGETLWLENVPYDFVLNTGAIKTIYPKPNTSSLVLNPPSTPYNNIDKATFLPIGNYSGLPDNGTAFYAKVNQNWLNTNGLAGVLFDSLVFPSHLNGAIYNATELTSIFFNRSYLNGDPSISGFGPYISNYMIFCSSFPCPTWMRYSIPGYLGWKDNLLTLCNIGNQPDYVIADAYASNFIVPLLSVGKTGFKLCNVSCNQSTFTTDTVSIKIKFPTYVFPDTNGLLNPSIINNQLVFDVLNSGLCNDIEVNWSIVDPTVFLPFSPNCYDFEMEIFNSNEINFSNNFDTLTACFFNSYDPNFIEVNKSEILNPTELEDLTYIIHFENEGNFPAVNIRLENSISSNLNLATFKYIESSHGCNYILNTTSRLLTIYFNDIYLESKDVDSVASKGYFAYSIEEISNLPLYDTIYNQASIFFDFNAPIVTNTAVNYNAIENASINELEESNDYMVYPNPSNSSIIISSKKQKNQEFDYSIYTSTGLLVKRGLSFGNETISIKDLSPGVYFISINGNYQLKLIRL
jgi:hypothetical protein